MKATRSKSEKKRLLLFSAAFLLGTAFLLFGIYRGEVAVVLKKAIYICLECIGIG
ncbi:MAG TPA: CD1871A family CXXC motif-containing protein [Clostridia bacterium]|nr:CD1871A family CXXC motif-containing protein [Clostridia bacterium]